jgi:hypothetical protein
MGLDLAGQRDRLVPVQGDVHVAPPPDHFEVKTALVKDQLAYPGGYQFCEG